MIFLYKKGKICYNIRTYLERIMKKNDELENKKDFLENEINNLKKTLSSYSTSPKINDILQSKKEKKEKYKNAKANYKTYKKEVRQNTNYKIKLFVTPLAISAILLSGTLGPLFFHINKNPDTNQEKYSYHYYFNSYDSLNHAINDDYIIDDYTIVEQNDLSFSKTTIETPYEKYGNIYRKSIFTFDTSNYKEEELHKIVEDGWACALPLLNQTCSKTATSYEYSDTINPQNNNGYIKYDIQKSEKITTPEKGKEKNNKNNTIKNILLQTASSLGFMAATTAFLTLAITPKEMKKILVPHFLRDEIAKEKGIDLKKEKDKVKSLKKEYKRRK